MPYDCVLFDLDGTLTDPGLGITNAVIHSLEKCGVQPPPREELYCFIGPPLLESYMKYYSMTELQARQAIVYYREYYSVGGLFENSVYPGIPELLEKLKSRGAKLAVATSKPETFSLDILRHYRLDGFFDAIAGSTLDGSLIQKADVIRRAVGMLPSLPQRPLMVGDRLHDIDGAHQRHMPCAAVLWGYGSREEFAEHRAEFIVETPRQLESLILA